MRQPNKRFFILIPTFCLLLIFFLYLAIRPDDTYKIGFGTGNLYLIKQAWFKEEKHKIEFKDGRWGWFRRGLWTEIAVPYESSMNDHYNIVLEKDGKIYMVRKDKLERHEIRYFDGAWHWHDTGSGEWVELPIQFDY